jgi:AraC-like DNA-binding protein
VDHLSDEPSQGGRPLIQIDMGKLVKLMALDPRREDAAAQMGCSVDTVERRIKEETGLTYNEFKDLHMAPTRLNLVQKALKMANDGDTTMLRAALKQFCGWSEKADSNVQVNVQNNLNVTVQAVDLEDRVKQLKGE